MFISSTRWGVGPTTYPSGWFAVGGRRLAGPVADHDSQFVGLFLQLTPALHLRGHVPTDFRDLAFNEVRQSGGSPPALPSPRTCHLGFRHALGHELNAEPETQSDEDQRKRQTGTARPESLPGFVLHLPFPPPRGVVCGRDQRTIHGTTIPKKRARHCSIVNSAARHIAIGRLA